MNKKRPVNLDLTTLKFPLPAIVSILHRISGFVLFFMIPTLLYMLHQSIQSEQSFTALATRLDGFLVKFILFGFVAALLYHLIAGCRHILMDMGFGESLAGGRLGAKIVFVVSVTLIILAGWFLW